MIYYRHSKGKETIECFANTSSEDVSATSPRKPFRLSKRNREQSKMNTQRGNKCTTHISHGVRVKTQWIGIFTPIFTKIGAVAVLVTESDSEFFGTWQQKPNKKIFKKLLTSCQIDVII